MNLWYSLLDWLPLPWLTLDFMKNALLAVLIMGPLFGLLSTMVVTGRMSFFSDALGHSGFTGIAIGVLCGAASPTWFAVALAVAFALLFSYVKSRTNQAAETVISVFSSTAVALGIFIATMNGSSFTKFNKYLIGDILSVTPGEIGLLAAVLLAVIVLWIFASNRLVLTAVHPQLASSRGIPVRGSGHELGGPDGHQLPAGPPRRRRPECGPESPGIPPLFRGAGLDRRGRRSRHQLLFGLLHSTSVGAHCICALTSRRNHRGRYTTHPVPGGYIIRPYSAKRTSSLFPLPYPRLLLQHAFGLLAGAKIPP